MAIETLGTARDQQILRGRIENLQALRGVAILLVLVYHLWRYEDWYLGGKPVLPWFAALGRAGVDLFFVISGFVMTTITQGRFQKENRSSTFLLRRIARIYPLYWFYTLVCLAIFLARPELMKRGEGTAGIGLVQSFLLLPDRQAPLLGQGWTLVYEMFFYVIFALILLRPERHKVRILLAWTGAILLLNTIVRSTHLADNSAALRLAANLLNLEFLAGCFAAILSARGGSTLAAPALALGVLCGIATLWAPPEWDRALIYLAPAALIVYGAVTLETRGVCFPRWLRWIGDISYSLYLSHMLVLSAVLKLLLPLQPKSPVAIHIVFVVVGAIATVSAGALSYFWLEKPLLKRAQAAVPAIISRLPGKGTSATRE